MKKEEYLAKIKAIEKEAERQKHELAIAFAKANSTVKVGDIVKDHEGFAQITNSLRTITYSMTERIPSAVYEGIALKADKTPKKGNPTRLVYQSNLNKS